MSDFADLYLLSKHNDHTCSCVILLKTTVVGKDTKVTWIFL